MLSFLTSEESAFEATLEEFLEPSLEAPNDQLLHNLMTTLKGEQHHTKSQIAFAQVVKSIKATQQNTNWLRIIKQLFILDKLMEENLFCEQISQLTVFEEQMREDDSQKEQIKSGKIVLLFWKLIKSKSKVGAQSTHIICQRRSHRKKHLEKLSFAQIFNQVATIEILFASIFELVHFLESKEKKESKNAVEWRNSGCYEYLCVQILYKLICLYSCQMLIHHFLTNRLSKFSTPQIDKFKRSVYKFKENCLKFHSFLVVRQKMKGFQQIRPEDVKNGNNDQLIKLIEEYALHKENQAEYLPIQTLHFPLEKMFVENKPLSQLNRRTVIPRLNINKTLEREEQLSASRSGNPFTNWHSSYSPQFPQKQIMTVDLILYIKQQENQYRETSAVEEQVDYCGYQDSCNYDIRSTNVTLDYQVNFSKRYTVFVGNFKKAEKIKLSNIYSSFSPKWNY